MNRNRIEYLAGLDGLRGLAVLAVVFYHMAVPGFPRGGFTGVDVFFVISGYVISKSLHERESVGLAEYFGGFYRRRILRIVPALLACLVITMLLRILFIPSSWLSASIPRTGIAAHFGLGNFALLRNHDGYFSPRVDYNPFLHTWSLAVEEQFYLLFPLCFRPWLGDDGRSSRLRRPFRAALIILSLASIIWSAIVSAADRSRAFYMLPSRFWELAAGSFLYLFHARGRLVPKGLGISRFFAWLGILLIGTGFLLADRNSFPFPWAAFPVSGAAVVICGIRGMEISSPGSRWILAVPPFSSVGKISYSMYLWHWPIAVLLRWTCGFEAFWAKAAYLALSFLLAVISYRFVENPIRYGRRLKAAGNLPVVIGGLLAVVLSAGVSGTISRAESLLSLSVTKDSYVWRSRRYAADVREQVDVPGIDLAGRRIFALGDSHAAAYRTMLRIVSSKYGMEALEFERGGCAVAGLLEPMGGIDGCEEFYRNSFSEIRNLARPGDIVLLASLRMPELSDQFEVLDIDAVAEEFSGEEAAAARKTALVEADRIIGDFEALGLHVVVDAPLPVLKAPPYRCSDWFNRGNPIAAPGTDMDRGFLLDLRRPIMDSLAVLRESHPDLTVWDPFFVLCDGEKASAYDGNGLPKFFDGDHLSAHGNRLLVPSFEEALLDACREPSAARDSAN